MNTNIENCNTELLEQQKKQLEHEIIYGENAGHFAVFDIEAGCRKTRTAENALVGLYKTGKQALFVRQFDNDCRESMININNLANAEIAFAYNNEDVSPMIARKIDIKNIPILIITHQKYKVLMMDKTKRNVFSDGRTTLVIDEFLSAIVPISLGEGDIETLKALFSFDPILLATYEKTMHVLIDFLSSWNKEDNTRKFTSFTDESLSKKFNTFIKLIKANLSNEKLAELKGNILTHTEPYGNLNYNLLSEIKTVKNLCNKILEYKQLFTNMCLYCDNKLHTTDKRYKYWYLANNIMLDASGELQIAYALNNEEFTLQHCGKVLNHENWKIINIPINTTTSGKEKILNFYDVVNNEIEKYGDDILVVGKKDEMSLINVPEENKGYFGNITGSNKWYNKKNVAIIQTHNLSDIDYILKYLHYASGYIDEKFDLSARSSGRWSRKIYQFTNPVLEDIRVHWIASEIYQSIKRINRNMRYSSDVIIFINNEKVIQLIQEQMVNCTLNVVDYSDEMFEMARTKQDDYIDDLKKDSYASRFIDFLSETQNGLHPEFVEKGNKISKVKVRNYLGIKTSGNFSNKVLNKTDVIFYCQTRNIKLDGQYIKLPSTG